MLTKAVDLANAAGKSRAYISQETKRGHLVRGMAGKYDTENKLNRDWIVAKGIKLSDLGSGIKIIKKQVRVKAVKKPVPKKKPVASQKKTPIKKAVPKKTAPKPEKTEQKKSAGKPKKQTPKAKTKSKIVKKDVNQNTESAEKSKPKIKPGKKKPIKPEDDLKNVNIQTLKEQTEEELLTIPDQLRTMTIEQIVYGHMNIYGLKSYAETLYKILGSLKIAVDIKAKKHELIERDFFRSHIVVYLDVMNEQLFDMAGTDKKKLKEYTKIIHHAKKMIDTELNKIIKIQEVSGGK